MKVKRPVPTLGGDRRRKPRQPARSAAHCNAQRRSAEAPPRTRRPNREQRPLRSAPQTGPTPRLGGPARPKSASQAKARAKARKAKAPKIVRLPLRERLLVRLASIELNPRALITRVPFVVLVIAALGLGLGITLWLSTGSAERSYHLGHARNVNQQLLQQKEALERDVLEAQAAPALAEAARKLGMIPSRDTAHLVQDPTGNWLVVGTPKPAEGVPPPPLNTPLPEDTPGSPPPRTPQVVDPRELTLRMPQAGQPVLPGQAAPAPGPVLPAAPGLVLPATPMAAAPADPAAPAPQAPAPQPPVEAVPAPQPPVEAAPVPPAAPDVAHLPEGAVPAAPGPATVIEQSTPAVVPVA